jgi:hypothetical protein
MTATAAQGQREGLSNSRRDRLRTTVSAAGVLALAGCGGAAASHATTSPAVAKPASSAPAPAPAATQAPAGPFKITVIYCGKYSAAQQAQFGGDTSGLIYKYTNVSSSVTGAPDLTVNFTVGATVVGSSDFADGSAPLIAPGQNATAEVEDLTAAGEKPSFTGCQLGTYLVEVANDQGGSTDQPGTFSAGG